MPTLKIQKADGTFEFLQLAGEEFADIGHQVIDVKSQLAHIATDVTTFGAVGDYNTTTQTGTDNYNSFVSAINKAKELNGELYIPPGNYYISQDIEFPRFVNCMGVIRGAKVIFKQLKDLNVKNLKCADVHFTGIWRGNIEISLANKVTIDGNVDWFGSFWNQFKIKYAEELEINISEGAVNQNHYTGGRIRYLRITGNHTKYPNSCEAHNNWFENFDLSFPGVLQDDTKMQTNYLVNSYSELAQGQDLIKGNWQIIGNTGEKTPTVGINSHILFTNDAVPASGQDYLSMSTTNLVEGGEWESLDAQGRPKGVTYSSASAIVEADETAPDGSGKTVKVTTSSSWGAFVINFSRKVGSKGGVTFFAKGDEIRAIEFVNSNNNVFGGLHTSVDVGNGWKLYRLIFPSGSNIVKANVFLNLSTAAQKTAYFSGIKATPFKVTLLPYYNPNIYCRGSLPSVPTSGIWRKGEFVTNNSGANSDVSGWLCVNDNPLTFQKMLLDNGSYMTKRTWQKAITDSNKTIAKVKRSDFANSAIIELTVRFFNSQSSSPDFTGYVGTAKYLIALTKESSTSRQKVTHLGTAKSDFQTVASGEPTITVEQITGFWDINVEIPSGQGQATCYCEMEYSLPTSGTTISFLET